MQEPVEVKPDLEPSLRGSFREVPFLGHLPVGSAVATFSGLAETGEKNIKSSTTFVFAGIPTFSRHQAS